jgi:uncharacterized membrane protein
MTLPQKLNLIRKIVNFPFVVLWRIFMFIFFPIIFIMGFLQTDFENKWDRDYFWGVVKKSISFGFWK